MTEPASGKPTPDPALDPIAGGKPDATLTPGAQTPGAGTPPAGGDKTVPIAALHEERTKRQELQGTVETLQKQMDLLKSTVGGTVQYDQYGNPIPVHPGAVAPQNPVNQNAQQLEELWSSDPRKAVQSELMMALNWYDKVNAAVDHQEAVMVKKHPDFTQFQGQIRNYIRQLPMTDRGKEGVVELAYFAIKGQSVDTVTDRVRKEMIDKLQRGESIQGLTGTFSAPAAPVTQQPMTDQQRNAARAMGLTEEQYMAGFKT